MFWVAPACIIDAGGGNAYGSVGKCATAKKSVRRSVGKDGMQKIMAGNKPFCDNRVINIVLGLLFLMRKVKRFVCDGFFLAGDVPLKRVAKF